MAMDSPPVELVWARQRRSAVVFAISDKGTLYRSADEGNTWTEQSSKLEKAQASLQVHGIHISPVDHQVVRRSSQACHIEVASSMFIGFHLRYSFKAPMARTSSPLMMERRTRRVPLST